VPFSGVPEIQEQSLTGLREILKSHTVVLPAVLERLDALLELRRGYFELSIDDQ
jgi:hypothetical protein